MMTSGRREGHGVRLAGMRTVLLPDDPRFPAALRVIPRPPKRLYVLGDPEALTEGLAVVGARKATPYGIGAAKRFARLAAQRASRSYQAAHGVATPPLTRRRFPKARPRWRFWVAAAMCRTLESMRACSSG